MSPTHETLVGIPRSSAAGFFIVSFRFFSHRSVVCSRRNDAGPHLFTRKRSVDIDHRSISQSPESSFPPVGCGPHKGVAGGVLSPGSRVKDYELL
jgi:hypothetical protein